MSEHPELDATLAALNKAVTDAIAARTAWMDEHMKDYAKFQVGDKIYERESGRLLGTVTRLYRFQAGRDPIYDTQMYIEYEYRADEGAFGSHFIGNTSCVGSYTPWHFATHDEAVAYQAKKLERMKA